MPEMLCYVYKAQLARFMYVEWVLYMHYGISVQANNSHHSSRVTVRFGLRSPQVWWFHKPALQQTPWNPWMTTASHEVCCQCDSG
jgi:hypothetical protein